MIYPHKPRFCFIHCAKAGGTSVTKTLANYFGFDRDKYRPAKFKFLKIQELLLAEAFPIDDGYPTKLSDYFLFGVIRNPFDRLVSYFHYRKQIRKPPHTLPADLTFESWVKSGAFTELTTLCSQLCVGGKVYPNIYVGRLEQIDRDWEVICAGLGIQTPLLHDKKSNHAGYRELYTDETRQIVTDYYRQDLEVFGYEF